MNRMWLLEGEREIVILRLAQLTLTVVGGLAVLLILLFI